MTGCSGNVRPRVLSAAATLLCWVILAVPAAAQTVSGIILDPTGRVVVGASVVAENKASLQRREVFTGSFGEYSIKRLPPGEYRILVKSGSLEGRKDVTVSVGRITPADIELKFVVTDSITVTTVEAPTALALPDGAMGTILSRPFLENLPGVNGRTIQSVLDLAPNIVVTETTGTQAQFTANGQRRFTNRTSIDGVGGDISVNVNGTGLHQAESGALPAFAVSGGTQTLVPMAAIDEIQVRTTNASVEYSRTPGAQIVIVTRTGSNRFTASGFSETRPRGLSATDWFDNNAHKPKRTGNYWDSGVTLGGPILPSKLSYFGTWQRQQINRDVVGTLRVPSLATREDAPDLVRPLFDAFPIPNGADLIGDDEGLAELNYRYPIVSALNALSVRVDATPWDVHRLFMRVNRGRSSGDSLGFDLLPSLSTSFAEATATNTATIGLTSTWSTVLHELRVNTTTHSGSVTANRFPFGNPGSLPLSMLVPASASDAYVQVNLFPGPGGSIAFGQFDQSRHHQFQLVDSWSLSIGRHDWRFGVDFRQATTEKNPASTQVFYRFFDPGDLSQRRVRNVLVNEYQPTRTRRRALSMFAQDAFRISPRISVNAGLRYGVKPAPESRTRTQPTLVTFETLPDVAYEPRGARLWNTSWTDFGPSVGAIFQLRTADGWETVLRSGWSAVYDELTSPGVSAFVNGYPFIDSRGLNISPFPVPASNLAAAAPRTLSYYSFPKDFRTPRTYDWQIGIEQSLGRQNRVGLAYVGAAGRDLTHWYAIDFGSEARIQTFSNEGRSDYHALIVEYVRRLSQGLQGRVAYTWGHAIDTDSGEATTPPLPPDVSPPSANRASADYDRRQLFHATASYQLPRLRVPAPFQAIFKDWQVDVSAVVATGAPVSVVVRRNPEFGSFDYRPDLVPGAPIWIPDQASPTGRRVNSEAFEVPVEFRQGTLGRNTLRGSTLRQVNLGVARSVRLLGRMTAQLRLDAFNVFNTPNFAPPYGRMDINVFGLPVSSYADALGTGTLTRGGLTPLQQAGGPRSVQLGLRLVY